MSDHWRIALAGALAFVVVTTLVPFCRRFALARGITDGPAQGKLHRTPTPYLGGVAIAVAAAGSSIVLPDLPLEAVIVLAAACVVSVAGLVDDIRGLRAATRLAIEFPAACAAVAAGARVHLFGTGVDFVISVAFLVVLTNAFNLLDNMDGVAGAMGTTIAIALATTALIEHQVLVSGLAVVVAATCLGFLVYNWHPAEIFMGDSGSLFLGFLLAIIALKLRTGVSHPASALALILLLGPALFDTALVVISRMRARRPIYIGGTDHTSHRLVLLGLSPVSAAVFLVVATALCAALGVLVAEGAVAANVTAPVVAVAAILGLAFMLRVGAYEPARGRGELSRADRSPVASTPAVWGKFAVTRRRLPSARRGGARTAAATDADGSPRSHVRLSPAPLGTEATNQPGSSAATARGGTATASTTSEAKSSKARKGSLTRHSTRLVEDA